MKKYRNFVAAHVVIASHSPHIATIFYYIATIDLRNASIEFREISISDDITTQ
uniref:Uncharacterized protein n=1 Tax=Candidatus Kentrum sp. UNK TaxID=2126344 RepID=A0A451B2Q5_9GAMM|nr:MAG: hypothetical protein BECKUNK1418G_GA0071005_11292 [Candidatus Kentron sp. UNK]VFK72553.1 MAG: hypothetical protein BECKUNK1418H_GA0071006_11222 [Candidatus Kentron sp. UNK]